MSTYITRKSSQAGRAQTIQRRIARAHKYGGVL